MAKKKKKGGKSGGGSGRNGNGGSGGNVGKTGDNHKKKQPPLHALTEPPAAGNDDESQRRESAPPALGRREGGWQTASEDESGLAELLGPLGDAPCIDELLDALSRKEALGRGPSPPRSSPSKTVQPDAALPDRLSPPPPPAPFSLMAGFGEQQPEQEAAEGEDEELDDVALELAALRAGGPGALHERKLQAALAEVEEGEAVLRLQELQLRRFCQQRAAGGTSAGVAGPGPASLLADCLAMLERRRSRQAAELQAGEAVAYRLRLQQRDEELAAVTERAEAAEAALATEHARTRQERAAASAAAASAAAATAAAADPAPEAEPGEKTEAGAAVGGPGGAVGVAVAEGSPQRVVEKIREGKLVRETTRPSHSPDCSQPAAPGPAPPAVCDAIIVRC